MTLMQVKVEMTSEGEPATMSVVLGISLEQTAKELVPAVKAPVNLQVVGVWALFVGAPVQVPAGRQQRLLLVVAVLERARDVVLLAQARAMVVLAPARAMVVLAQAPALGALAQVPAW